MKNLWVYEKFPPDNPVSKTGLRIKKRLLTKHSPCQRIEVVESEAHGRVLILDSIFQTCQADEFIYHEMIAHLSLFYHPAPKKILIIGGGDGGVLREVLKHPLEKAFLVEIDRMVIEAVEKFIPSIPQGAFQDKKAEIIIKDGVEFIKEYKNFFDIIIIDSSDPFGPSQVLFSKNFYQNVFQALNKSGLMICQSGDCLSYFQGVKRVQKLLKQIFPFVSLSLANVPLYGEGLHGFSLGSKKDLTKITLAKLKRRFNQLSLKTKYYCPEIHQSSGYLPNFLKNNL